MKKTISVLMVCILMLGMATPALATESYTVAVPAIYDAVRGFREGRAWVQQDGKWGCVDTEGNIIVDFKYDDVQDFEDGYAWVGLKYSFTNSTVWGLVSVDGTEIFEPKYFDPGTFIDGLVRVSDHNQRRIIIDTQGNEIYKAATEKFIINPINAKYAFVTEEYLMSTGYGYYDPAYRDGVLDLQTLKYVIPLEGNKTDYFFDQDENIVITDYSSVGNFSDGLALAQKYTQTSSTYGYINQAGELKIDTKFSHAEAFSEGLAYAVLGTGDSATTGFIDKTGEFVFELPEGYSPRNLYTDGVVLVVDSSRKTALMNTLGELITPAKYDLAYIGSRYGDEGFVYLGNGLFALSVNNKYGIVDNKGNELTPFVYDSISSDSRYIGKLLIVTKDGLRGILDRNGNELVPAEYESCNSTRFTDGSYARNLQKDGKYYQVNEQCELVEIDEMYVGITFYDGYARVLEGNGDETRYGTVDEQYNFVVPLGNRRILETREGMVIYAEDGKYGFLRIGEAPASAPTPTTAKPTSATVLVNGEQVAFDAYVIGGNNYFKLRDLASILSGTEAQFEVIWDETAKAIRLTSGKAYTPVGGEMTGKGTDPKTPNPTTATVYLDGTEIDLTAYNIGNNNYFKLRDVGEALDFGVVWDHDAKTVIIDTRVGYDPNK